MSRILMVWELGKGYGHMDGFEGIALALRERGHEVSFALRDLSRAEKILGRHGFALIQAPVWLPPPPDLPPAGNYAEMLYSFGFLDTAALTGMLKGWRAVYEAAAPDLVLLNHAPTALLAARCIEAPAAMFGTGFECLPAVDGLPCIMPWVAVPPARLTHAEAHVTRVMNTALERLGVSPLETFADFLRDARTLLCTIPELDPFRDWRPEVRYFGPVVRNTSGIPATWPPGGRYKIFAYLKPEDPRTQRALHELTRLPASVLVHAPNLAPGKAQRFQSAGTRFLPQPLDMGLLAQGCDLVVCHGGHGTVLAALRNGCPLLLVPSQGEQLLTAACVAAAGAGAHVKPDDGPERFRELLNRVLGEPGFTAAAHGIAEKYAQLGVDDGLADFVKAVECLLASPA